jgi:hypothetical protein
MSSKILSNRTPFRNCSPIIITSGTAIEIPSGGGCVLEGGEHLPISDELWFYPRLPSLDSLEGIAPPSMSRWRVMGVWRFVPDTQGKLQI